MKVLFSPNSQLVYSTEGGKTCPQCRQPIASCTCKKTGVPPVTGPVRVMRQTKGRGGKSVTLVQGLPLDATALNALAKQLRTACGSGATVKAGVIEVQGDHCDRILDELQRAGFAAKRSGG